MTETIAITMAIMAITAGLVLILKIKANTKEVGFSSIVFELLIKSLILLIAASAVISKVKFDVWFPSWEPSQKELVGIISDNYLYVMSTVVAFFNVMTGDWKKVPAEKRA